MGLTLDWVVYTVQTACKESNVLKKTAEEDNFGANACTGVTCRGGTWFGTDLIMQLQPLCQATRQC